MSTEEKAKIVALVRVLGIEGSDAEIIEKYSEAYNNAYAAFSSKPVEPVKGEVFKRPW